LKTKTLLTFFLALLILFGDAQSWIYVASDLDQSKIYVCPNLVYLPHTIEIWVKTTEGNILYDKDGVQVNIPGGSTLCFLEIDYLNQKYRIHSIVILDSFGKISDVLDLNGPQSCWYPIIPNSVYEKVLKTISELFS
jgi:hypothetical protein